MGRRSLDSQSLPWMLPNFGRVPQDLVAAAVHSLFAWGCGGTWACSPLNPFGKPLDLGGHWGDVGCQEWGATGLGGPVATAGEGSLLRVGQIWPACPCGQWGGCPELHPPATWGIGMGKQDESASLGRAPGESARGVAWPGWGAGPGLGYHSWRWEGGAELLPETGPKTAFLGVTRSCFALELMAPCPRQTPEAAPGNSLLVRELAPRRLGHACTWE